MDNAPESEGSLTRTPKAIESTSRRNAKPITDSGNSNGFFVGLANHEGMFLAVSMASLTQLHADKLDCGLYFPFGALMREQP